MEKIHKLSVMIPARDRLVLTEKCIDSIWKNSDAFEQIQIYVYDNKSDLNQERSDLFLQLLSDNKIQYYSYDTNTSSMNCFGKVITFNRWVDMMRMEKEVYENVSDPSLYRAKNYYLLLDNDFILGPRWGEYFISTCDVVRKYEEGCKFIIPFPGGIPGRSRNGPEWYIDNKFRDEQFTIKAACGGGASGMWFMDYDMLQDMRWDNSYIASVYGINKRHDTNSWNHIRKKFGAANYTVAIMRPDDADPLAIHMGGQTGSVCNQLRRRTYDENKEGIRKAEIQFKDRSCDDIYNDFKLVARNW